MNYEITERLDSVEMALKIDEINSQYAFLEYKHKKGGLYKTQGATVININGTAYWGLIYYKLKEDGTNDYTIPFTRPLFEFLDGRFELIKK